MSLSTKEASFVWKLRRRSWRSRQLNIAYWKYTKSTRGSVTFLALKAPRFGGPEDHSCCCFFYSFLPVLLQLSPLFPPLLLPLTVCSFSTLWKRLNPTTLNWGWKPASTMASGISEPKCIWAQKHIHCKCPSIGQKVGYQAAEDATGFLV